MSSSDFQFSFSGQIAASLTVKSWSGVAPKLSIIPCIFFYYPCGRNVEKKVFVKNSHSELWAQVLVISNIPFTCVNTGQIIRHLLNAFSSVSYSAKYKIIIKGA